MLQWRKTQAFIAVIPYLSSLGCLQPARFPFSLTSLFLPLFGSRCYLLGQAITSLLLFITSAAWPPNHPSSAARLMQTTSCSQLGVPYLLSKCNPKPRKKSTPPRVLSTKGGLHLYLLFSKCIIVFNGFLH